MNKVAKKRIYFLLEYLGGRGGVENVLMNVTRYMEQLGYYVAVLLPNKSEDNIWESQISNLFYYNEDVNLEIDNKLEFISSKVDGLNKLFDNIGYPDIIVASHMPITTLYSRLLIGYTHDIKIISWIHSPLALFGDSKKYLKYADIHWGISDNIISELKNEVDEDLIYKVSNPISMEVENYNLELENNFIYIGRLENYTKRLDVLLNALSMCNFDWKLDIYGDGQDRYYVEEIIDKLNLSKKVNLKGYVENPWSKIKNAKALLLSSDYESFSLVVAEALCRGIPVVSTKSAGPIEMIEDGHNGYLADLGNVDSFKEKIEIISKLSADELERLKLNATKSVGDFSIEKVIERMRLTLKT